MKNEIVITDPDYFSYNENTFVSRKELMHIGRIFERYCVSVVKLYFWSGCRLA